MQKTLITLAIVASLSALSGCGSSDSGDGGGEKMSVALSGTAAKGIIQSGIVTAIELSSTGTVIGEVGSAITDVNGQYNLVLTDDYKGGVVKLTISAGDNTIMKCDATDGCGAGKDFGSDIALSESFSLDAIVQPETGAEAVSVQITPLTHMATARALQSSVIDSTSVNSAINEVGQIVGVDIMGSPIVDITSATSLASASEASKKLALFNAGLADLLVKESTAGNTPQENIEANLEKLASSFSDGEFDENDAVKITDITTAVGNAITNVAANAEIKDALSESIQDVQTIVSVVEGDVVNGVYNPEPSSTANSTEIEKGKALLSSARTFIETIATDFEDPLDALNIDADAVATVLDSDTVIMAELLEGVIEQTLDYLDQQELDFVELLDNGSTTYTVPVTTGTEDEMIVTFSSDESGIAITINGDLTGEQTVEINDLKLATNLTESDLTINDGLLDAITAITAQVEVTGSIGNNVTSLTLNEVSLSLSASDSVSFDTTEDGNNDGLEDSLTGASFMGDISIVSHGASFAGDVEIVLVSLAQGSAVDVPLSLQKINIEGSFSSIDKGSFTAGAKLVIDNATSFDTFGYLDYDSSAYAYTDFGYSLSTSDLAIVSDAVGYTLTSDSGLDIYYQRYNDTYIIYYEADDYDWSNGNYAIELPDLEQDFLINATEMMYSEVPDGAAIQWLDYHARSDDGTNVWGEVKINLPDFESADNFVQGSLTLMATAELPDLPTANVVATVSRTELNGGDASIVVSSEGQSFTLTLDSEDFDADEPLVTLSLSNADGVEMTVNLTETAGEMDVLSGDVFVGENKIATISETDDGVILVRYTDGTFETLY